MFTRVLALVAMAMLLLGCADQIRPATKHAPTSSDQVKLYQEAPSQYEQLGLIHVPVGGVVKWDQSGDANAGFEQFKTKAAELGANGVLLIVPAGVSDAQVTAGYNGRFYTLP